VASTYLEAEEIEDLTSDHTPVLMTVSITVRRKKRKSTLTNKYTDWNMFHDKLDELINLQIRLKSVEELEQHAK
jgi:hypothetical protein